MKRQKGRPKIHKFSSEEFQTLSVEERQLRGRISTLRRMIKKRELDIIELMKPIQKKKKEIEKSQNEIFEIQKSIDNMGYEFPTFRVEDFYLKGNTYYRGVWYVDSKKKQLYLGSEKKVLIQLNKTYPNIVQPDRNLDKVLNVYLKELQMRYWKDEYENRND
jgi:hypothetical protein